MKGQVKLKYLIKVFLFVVWGLFIHPSFAQESEGEKKLNLPQKDYYGHAYIGWFDSLSSEVKVYKLKLGKDSANFKVNNVILSFPYEQISYLRVPYKSKGIGGLLIGGSIGIVSSILITRHINKDPDNSPDTHLRENVLPAMLVGSILGVMIGNGLKSYKFYYLHEKSD